MPKLEDEYFLMGDRDGTRDTHYGVSPCIAGRPQIIEGSTLNNCVGAVWGLFAKAENNPNCKVGFVGSRHYPSGASAWWNGGNGKLLDNYARGTEIKLGAIACWSNHLGYVNEIMDNGDFVVIQSILSNDKIKGLETMKVYKNKGYKIWDQEFLGFIYPKKVIYSK